MPKTPNRVFRIPDDIYDTAKRIADQRNDLLTRVVIEALEQYIRSSGEGTQDEDQ